MEVTVKRPEIKREESKLRDEERAKRTPQEQLALLDRKFGKDEGAKKERTRLLQQIQGQRSKKAEASK